MLVLSPYMLCKYTGKKNDENIICKKTKISMCVDNVHRYRVYQGLLDPTI